VAETFGVELPSGFYFAVTCCSDLILRTCDLRYSTRLNAEILAAHLALADPEKLKLVYHHASTEKIGGWNALWRLPKPVKLAIGKGSVFLFAYTGDSQNLLIQQLYALEQQGIGNRKSEGFGWVSISDAFHQEGTQL
jgi:CRISPR-associated protein Csx10